MTETGMEFISSDTNVWIDFSTINKLDLPFRLPYTYIMNGDAIDEELLSPPNLKSDLLHLGLKSVEIDGGEFILAAGYGLKYKQLSVHDRIALAIAKNRNLTLLTGDAHLRSAARKESVSVMGTIGVLDRLLAFGNISEQEYDDCLKEFLKHNGEAIRLPEDEIKKRLSAANKLFIINALNLK